MTACAPACHILSARHAQFSINISDIQNMTTAYFHTQVTTKLSHKTTGLFSGYHIRLKS